MSESLDVVVNLLSDTSFRVKQLASSLEDMESSFKHINKTIEIETHKSWKKVIERDDLKVVCEADPKMIFHVESLALSSKKNSEAILAFNNSFTKKIEALEGKLEKISIIQREAIYKNENECEKNSIKQPERQYNIQNGSENLLNKKCIAMLIATNVATALAFYILNL